MATKKLTEAQIVALREFTHDVDTYASVSEWRGFTLITNGHGWASDVHVRRQTIEALYQRGYLDMRYEAVFNRYTINAKGRAALREAIG